MGKKRLPQKITVCIDSNEQQPFTFHEKDVGWTLQKKLPTGDYTIEGLEEIVCIERKGSVQELAGNLMSTDLKRFEAELVRMQDFKYRYIVCEFSWADLWDYPWSAKLPPKIRKRIRVRGEAVVSKLIELSLKYDVQVYMCGTKIRAQRITGKLLKKIAEKELLQ
jgi:hypothetical protein